MKLPTEQNTGTGAAVDDSAQFLTAAQVTALVAVTPWPYNVMVHLAAWSGLRAAEIAGLQVGDVTVPKPSKPERPGEAWCATGGPVGRADRGGTTYIAPKTKGSRRTVPLTAATTSLVRDYLRRIRAR